MAIASAFAGKLFAIGRWVVGFWRFTLLLLPTLLTACASPVPPPSPAGTPVADAALPSATLRPSAAAPTTSSTACLTRPAARRPAPGLNVFLLKTDADYLLTLTHAAGFGWVRQQIHWRDINGDGMRFDWRQVDAAVAATQRYQLQLLISVVRSPDWASPANPGGLPEQPADFADFMGLLATRYRSRVAAYEIWNEPNLALENGGVVPDPAAYLAVLEAAYPAVKRADPCALVLSAPLAATTTADPAVAADDLNFLQQLYSARDGAFLRSADVVGVHSGGGNFPPDARWPTTAPERSRFYFRHLEQLRALMQRNGDRRPVWVTEYGWTVTRAPGAPAPVTLRQQADYLVEALELAHERYPWVEAMFVWNLNFAMLGPPGDEKTTFGILAPDGRPRPAYAALRQALGGVPGPLPPPPRSTPSPLPTPLLALPASPPAAPAEVRLGPTVGALDAAWSPAGSALAALGWDGSLRLWNTRGAELATRQAHARPARQLAWSPRGDLLALASWDGTISLWQGAEAHSIARLSGQRGPVAGLAWSPSGDRLLSWGWDGQALIWQADGWREPLGLAIGVGPVTGAAWSPDGAVVAATGWSGRALVWRAEDGRLLAQLPGLREDLAGVAWSPQGDYLATWGWDGALRLWSWPGLKLVQTAQHSDPLATAAWSPDGLALAAGGLDGRVLRLDPASGQVLTSSRGHDGPVWVLAWRPDAQALYSGGADGRVVRWMPRLRTAGRVLADYAGPIWTLSWQSGRLMAASGGGAGVVIVNSATIK